MAIIVGGSQSLRCGTPKPALYNSWLALSDTLARWLVGDIIIHNMG